MSQDKGKVVMDWNTWSYLAKYSIGKPRAIKQYKEAKAFEKLSPEDANIQTWESTKKLVLHAYENVPWYQETYKSMGISPKDIQQPVDFEQLPILTRSDIIDNFDAFVSKKTTASKLKFSTTGGSTGTPLKIGMDPNLNREVPKWQMFSWWSISPAKNMASIYRGLPITGLKKLALSLINYPQKVVRLDATNLTEQAIKEFIEACKKVKPVVIHGYVGAIDVISDYILEHEILVPSPEVIWTTAAPISKVQEEKISSAFQAPVCDQYGCSEIYFIAAQCPQKQGLHQFSDAVKLEIADDHGSILPNKTWGNILITNLKEYQFPLIRYQNGDRGRWLDTKCSCGNHLPLMDKVKGRISDNIIIADDIILSGEYLTTIFDDFTSAVKQFQVIQHKDKTISVNVVPKGGTDIFEKAVKSVERELEERIQGRVSYAVKVVPHIPVDKGKLRFIIKE